MTKLYASKNDTITIEECEGLAKATAAAPVVVVTRRIVRAIKVPKGSR